MEKIDTLIDELVDRIKDVKGVSAVVLGGSRAIGTHTEESDVDLGIYYDPENLLDIAALGMIAADFDDKHRTNVLTPIGGWGPWINGGGWLIVQSIPVDFIYRDLRRVSGVIDACHQGHVGIEYQPGHPHGFISSIYLSEVSQCRVLWEVDSSISALKERTQPYPARLKKALFTNFDWEIDFSLALAQKSVKRGDVTYAAGCSFRCVACILQVLFALNERYWMNEKGAVAIAGGFQQQPPRFKARIENVFRLLAASENAIEDALAELDKIARETQELIAQHHGVN